MLGSEFVYESFPLMIGQIAWVKGTAVFQKGLVKLSPVFSYILLREKVGLWSKQEQLSIFFKVLGDVRRQCSIVYGMECFLLSFDCLCFKEIFSFFCTLIAQSSYRISYWLRQPHRRMRLDRHSPKLACKRPSQTILRSFIAQLKLVYLLYPQILKQSFCGGTKLLPEMEKLNAGGRRSYLGINQSEQMRICTDRAAMFIQSQ